MTNGSSDKDPRKTWETIGEEDPYCGTGGPTRAVPKAGKFAEPDSGLFDFIKPNATVLDVGCGTGGPARYLAHRFGCRVDGIDLTPERIETGRVLTERCKLGDRVALQVGNALELPYPD